MAKINNPEAYFRKVVRNSYKNEYRSNDNFFKHISSVGDETDIQEKYSQATTERKQNTDSVENLLSETSAENWLLFMENDQLHKALRQLPVADVEFLFTLAEYHFKQSAFAQDHNLSRQAVSKRFQKLKRKILNSI